MRTLRAWRWKRMSKRLSRELKYDTVILEELIGNARTFRDQANLNRIDSELVRHAFSALITGLESESNILFRENEKLKEGIKQALNFEADDTIWMKPPDGCKYSITTLFDHLVGLLPEDEAQEVLEEQEDE